MIDSCLYYTKELQTHRWIVYLACDSRHTRVYLFHYVLVYFSTWILSFIARINWKWQRGDETAKIAIEKRKGAQNHNSSTYKTVDIIGKYSHEFFFFKVSFRTKPTFPISMMFERQVALTTPGRQYVAGNYPCKTGAHQHKVRLSFQRK